jgi:surface antigen
VLACGDREMRRRVLYNGTGALRLCRPHWLAAAAALFAALTAAGCSISLDSLDSIFPKGEADAAQTGSIARQPQHVGSATSAAEPSEADLAYARAVAAEALARGGRDISMPWENPDTGAGGSITPIAANYSEGLFTCRDFLASYVRGQQQSWLQGEACRTEHGKWEVKSLKPMKQG